MPTIPVPNPQKIRYLLVGAINTLFGYAIGVGLYKLLSNQINIISIGIISNIICITLSFTTYKVLVFRTKGGWISEYLRAYLVYGSMAIVGVIFLWFFVDVCELNIWIAQALVIFITVVFSYIGHARFTFKRNRQ
jgi:putative flippase GtrA